MLHVSGRVNDIVLLVLASVAKLYLNVIYKNLVFIKAFSHNNFERDSGIRHYGFGSYLPLILLSPIKRSLLEEHGGKNNLLVVSRLGRSKIVFALLDEIITIHVHLTFINL